jgi:hypothetical protein
MDLSFPMETRGGISHEIARWLGIDGQDAFRGAHEKVTSITVHFVDEHDHELPITEVREAELNGPTTGLDTIVRIIESAVMRDAATRWGNPLYAIYFHLTGGQNNRGRYPFNVAGSAHMFRNGSNMGGGSMVRHGRGGGGMDGYGAGQDAMLAQDAMKIVPELLRWSTEERRVNDERVAVAFRTQQETIKMQATIIESFNDREIRIRDLENELLDRKYEIEKKRKKDEESEKRWATLWRVAEQYGLPLGAMILPPVIESIRKLNAGPNYVPNEMNFDKVQEIIKNAQAAAEGGGVHINAPPKPSDGANGQPNGAQNGGAPNGAPHEQPPPQGPNVAPGPPMVPPGMHPLEAFHRQIALDLVRFMGLVRMKGHIDLIKTALEDPGLVAIYDEIVQATVVADASNESIDKLAQLALQFGATLQQHEAIAMKLFVTVDGFEQEAMRGLMQLLMQYGAFVQHLMQQEQQRGQGGDPQGPPPQGAPPS